MSNWFASLMAGFDRAAQSTSSNRADRELEAQRAAVEGKSVPSSAIADALGSLAADANQTRSQRGFATQIPSDRWKTAHGGADVIRLRDAANRTIGFRVQSLIYVYSDVPAIAGALANWAATIQTQINDHWNNLITPPANTPALATPLGQPFGVLYRESGESPSLRYPVQFQISVQPLTLPVGDRATRERFMNTRCEQAMEWPTPTNLVFIHLNDDNGAANGVSPISWAAGQMGSWSINAAPGAYAHEMGHLLGYWRWDPNQPNGYPPAAGGQHALAGTMSIMGATPGRRVLQQDVDLLNFSFGLGEVPMRVSSQKPDFPSPYALRGPFWRHPQSGLEAKTVGHRESAQVGGRIVRDRVIELDMTNFAAVILQTPY